MSDEITLAILETIIDSICIVEERSAKVSQPEDFVSNANGVMILDSIAMRLQVIGEQVKKLENCDPNLTRMHPEIEWKKIMKLRDLISHHYDSVDHEIVFDICRNHIGPLKDAINTMISKVVDEK